MNTQENQTNTSHQKKFSFFKFDLIKFCTASLLLALTILLTRHLSIMALNGLLRLDLGQVPLELASFLLGPFYGAALGLLSDIVGTMLKQQGQFHWGITFDYVLIGLLPGLSYKLFKKKAFTLPYLIGVQCIISLGINWLLRSYWLSGLMKQDYLTVVLMRFLPVALSGAIYVLLLYVLLKALQAAKLKVLEKL